MEIESKLFQLGESARFDLCNSRRERESNFSYLIHPAVLPGGGCINLLKVLYTNECGGECFYCSNYCNSPKKRLSFMPDELARLFLSFYQQGFVKGLFLSSGLGTDQNQTQQEMIDTVEILRKKFMFRGYIHLKILPGVKEDLIVRGLDLADRVSINLEAPSDKRLKMLSRRKINYDDLLGKISFIKNTIEKRHLKKDQTTQLVIGASEESDKEILSRTYNLYQDFQLKRVYYSAFKPLPSTPFSDKEATPLIREVRLYQADFLLREYNFHLKDILFDSEDTLNKEIDPKLMYARLHPEIYPIEINKADYFSLLKVPGIGPKSAKRIIENRRKNNYKSTVELKSTGAVLKRALPFITIDGKLPEKLIEDTNQLKMEWREAI